MEAMILAAGLGTRLRPLTDHTPKALVEVGGVPMLERVARRLVAAGATRLVVNVHAHAGQIRDFIEARGGFGVEVLISEEPERPLETGGGLLRAAPLFEGAAPFFLHNVDVLTDLDLRALYEAHVASGALATLAVRPPETERYLLFDAHDTLCGYAAQGREHLVRDPGGDPVRLDFCGVQVLSPRLFALMTETGIFSIISVYLRLVQQGERIAPFRVHGAAWIDVGKPERLETARQLVQANRL